MKRKFGILILLAAASFSLTAEDCVLQNKDIEVPLRGDVDMMFTSQGFTDADAETVDFGAELLKIQDEAGDDVESLVSGGIEGGFWRLVENRGDPNTTLQGSVDVFRMSTAVEAVLIPETQVDLSTVGMTFVPAPLEAAGVDLLTEGFQEYINWWNGDQTGPFPDLRYIFVWNSVTSTDADFDWEGRLRFILTGVFSVEVPDLW